LTRLTNNKKYILKTDRIGLRNWLPSDVVPFSEMSRDREVMKYFPKLLSKEDSKSFITRMQLHFETYGFCYFAIDILETEEFIGFTGMLHQSYESSFTPCLDIGWRLKKSAWGKGYATEAAFSCLNFANQHLHIKELYSVASASNIDSISVMKKIGMTFHSTFQHPALIDYESLKDCELYHKAFI